MSNVATRALALTGALATLWAGSLTGIAPARAHVHAVSPGAIRGTVAVVTFEVPNESQTGSATTEFTVTLPDVATARSETKSGWTTRVERDSAAGTVRSVTWTAAANAGIGVDQFGLFRVSMKLPDADAVSFPAVQRYADGTVVRWDQAPLPGGGEPDRPAATLTLATGPAAPPEHHPATQHPAPSATAGPAQEAEDGVATATDNPARLLAGVALLVAALGVTITITRRRA